MGSANAVRPVMLDEPNFGGRFVGCKLCEKLVERHAFAWAANKGTVLLDIRGED